MQIGTRSFNLFIICTFFSLVLIFLESKNYLNLLHEGVQKITTPSKASLYTARTSLTFPFQSIMNIMDREKRIQALEYENSELQSRLVQDKALEEENISMRKLLQTEISPSWKFAPARVIQVFGDNLYVLSENDYPEDTPAVITQDVTQGTAAKSAGVYVGRVKDKKGSELNIMLASAAESKIPVIVRKRSTLEKVASGIVVGKGGSAILEQVLASENIETSDLILTSGGSGFPAELLIGEITRVYKAEGNAWRQGDVKLAPIFENVNHIFLITKF